MLNITETMDYDEIMEKADHPFLMKLCFAFQDEEKVFFIMDFAKGGDLFFHL